MARSRRVHVAGQARSEGEGDGTARHAQRSAALAKVNTRAHLAEVPPRRGRLYSLAISLVVCASWIGTAEANAAPPLGGAYAGPTVQVSKEGRFRNAPALMLTVSRGRVVGVAATGDYGEPGHCGGKSFGPGPYKRGISLPAMRIARNDAFGASRRFGDVSIRVGGRFGHSGRTAAGVIHYRQPATQQFSGCNFDVDFRVHVLPRVPHGAISQPAAVSRYTGESYQGEKLTMQIAPDRASIARLNVTLRGECRNGENLRESFFSMQIPITAGRFAFDNAFRDAPDSANARLTGSGAFVGRGRVATGRLRIRLTLDNGNTCDSGQVRFVAGP